MLPDAELGPVGTEVNPIELEGIDVTVSRWGWLTPWLVGGVAAWALYELLD